MSKYKIYLEAAADVPAGWFDGRAFSCNRMIYARTEDESKAALFDRDSAIYFVTHLAKGWPCKCVPPIHLTL